MTGIKWNVSVDAVELGTATTENRFTLIEQAVADGKIPADYDITKVKFSVASY